MARRSEGRHPASRARSRRAAERAVNVPQERGSRSRGSELQVADEPTRLAAHEMRGHLAVLAGYVSMLDAGDLGELPTSVRSVLRQMNVKTRAISRLVDDMLEDARYRDGQLHLARRTLDLRTIVVEAVKEAAAEISDLHQIRSTLPETAIYADVDPRRVATIIRNLLDNAAKYSPNGGLIDIDVTVARSFAVVTVSDEGVGIDPREADSLFGRFQRGRRRTREGAAQDEGVGLGLYICRTLARLHGGEVEAEPRAVRGSRFTLRLPIRGSALLA
jgi:signal transduction histidine kinase